MTDFALREMELRLECLDRAIRHLPDTGSKAQVNAAKIYWEFVCPESCPSKPFEIEGLHFYPGDKF